MKYCKECIREFETKDLEIGDVIVRKNYCESCILEYRGTKSK